MATVDQDGNAITKAKASAQITLYHIVDIEATYRFYLIQSSTATKPSKPTEFPPTAWDDTEPSYVEGSTNSLYYVDCTVYTDGTYQYSEVSLSSSYEASKIAYNKAQNAQDTANSANDKADELYSNVEEISTSVSNLEATSDSITATVESLKTTTTSTENSLSKLEESYESFVKQTAESISATLTSSIAYADELTQHAREISTYFEASEEGLRISQSDSGDSDTNRTSTLMAPDSFQVQFDGIASTTIYREGIETGSLWLSTALTLNPLIFTGYGSGESGGVVIKWRGFD